MSKALLLYSGGLDSLLAGKVLQEQGARIIALNCILPFTAPDADPGLFETSRFARNAGFELIHHRLGQEYVDMTRNPAHGYGKNMNPCIDCKIHFIKIAETFMEKAGADYIATGEVVGQRPMSQLKHTINHIASSVTRKGLLLRPLSARLLKPTIPETEGLVDRDKLLAISGRGRKEQFRLAQKYGIQEYLSPSGGCFFTDVNISKRIRDLYARHEDVTPIDLHLLTLGRNLRLSPLAKIIVAKNSNENITLIKHMSAASYYFIAEFSGPHVLAKGTLSADDIKMTARIMARYGNLEKGRPAVSIYENGAKKGEIEVSSPAAESEVEAMII